MFDMISRLLKFTDCHKKGESKTDQPVAALVRIHCKLVKLINL